MVRGLMVFVVVTTFSSQVLIAARSAQDGAQQAEETTGAGCLQAGSKEGEFALVNDENDPYQSHPPANTHELALSVSYQSVPVGVRGAPTAFGAESSCETGFLWTMDASTPQTSTMRTTTRR
jgi:hypothetical protein